MPGGTKPLAEVEAQKVQHDALMHPRPEWLIRAIRGSWIREIRG
jgi:hypothetical protein